MKKNASTNNAPSSEVDAAERQRHRLYALLHEQDNRRDAVRELFQNGNQHQRPVTHWVARNHQEHELPRERHADEAVEKLRVRDRGRIVLCDLSLGEIQRRDHQDPVHPGDAEYPARELHERTSVPAIVPQVVVGPALSPTLSQPVPPARLANMNPHRIVIAGAGYAGVSCALRLARRAPSNVAITLVSATDRFIERIRLHQRATGQSVGEWSLRALIRGTGVELHIGNIDQLDYGNRVLKLGGDRLEFDTLVLALGSHVDVDSVKGVREHAMAVEFGTVSNIHRALQKAATHRGRVAIVGGGLTGIELASEIAESFPDSAGLARNPDARRGVVVRSGAQPCARVAAAVRRSRRGRSAHQSGSCEAPGDRSWRDAVRPVHLGRWLRRTFLRMEQRAEGQSAGDKRSSTRSCAPCRIPISMSLAIWPRSRRS